MEHKTYKSYDELPLMLSVQDVADVLGISISGAYELVKEKGFPCLRFFPLPNIIFDLGLTAEEIAVYAFLMKCEDRRTYTCYPSYKTIGDAIGKSRNTVIKYVNMLEEKELITKRKSFVITKDGKAWNGNLIFKIAPLRNEQDVYYYQQMWKRRNIPYFKPEKRRKRR